MCRWMGSHFHNWTDYNGVTFLVELLEWGRKFSAVVLIFNSRLALNSVLEITMTFAEK